MEETTGFEELAKREGNVVTPFEPSEEFTKEFSEYMEKSQSEKADSMQQEQKRKQSIFI